MMYSCRLKIHTNQKVSFQKQKSKQQSLKDQKNSIKKILPHQSQKYKQKNIDSFSLQFLDLFKVFFKFLKVIFILTQRMKFRAKNQKKFKKQCQSIVNNVFVFQLQTNFTILIKSFFPPKLQQQQKAQMFQDLTSLVLDIGTLKSKIGYGGDDAPKIIANSVLSKNSSMDVEGTEKYLVGDKYLTIQRSDRQIESIYKKKDKDSCQIDFEKYEPFVSHMLKDQLQVDVSNYSILLSEDVSLKPHEMRHHRQKIAEFLFQQLNVPNIYFLKNPVLGCFATGRSTALVCDSGDTYTRVTPVHDGFCLYKSSKSIPYGGSTVTQSIRKIVQKAAGGRVPTRFSSQVTESFRQYQELQVLRDIKQSFSLRQTEDGIEEITTVDYELPDKSTITVNRSDIEQKILSTEVETIKGITYKGIPSMITDIINQCDIDIKKELYSNILLTGGNMLFSNTMQQILGKTSELAPPNAKVKSVAMIVPEERVYASWIGGSIVTSLSSFQSYWVGKEQWKQHGLSIIDKKCN